MSYEVTKKKKMDQSLMHIASERRQSEKATYYMTAATWHSGKDKTIESVKPSVVAKGSESGEG